MSHDRPHATDWRPQVRDIVAAGLWCVIEVCTDPATQTWEPRSIIFSTSETAIADGIGTCVSYEPGRDARIAAYTRDALRRVRDAPTPVCHLARPELAAA